MFKISFDFDEITGTVTNMKVNKSDGVKIRGGFNASPNVQPTDVPDIVVEENRLLISPSALATMDVKADDRISIQYWNEGIGSAFPIIGKAQVFTSKLDGNRVSKTGTVSFRGEKRATLLEFGDSFNLEPFKEGIWKLIPTTEKDSESDLTNEVTDLENLNNSEIEKEIENLLSEDDLPFNEI